MCLGPAHLITQEFLAENKDQSKPVPAVVPHELVDDPYVEASVDVALNRKIFGSKLTHDETDVATGQAGPVAKPKPSAGPKVVWREHVQIWTDGATRTLSALEHAGKAAPQRIIAPKC